jgi:hypothetical protein
MRAFRALLAPCHVVPSNVGINSSAVLERTGDVVSTRSLMSSSGIRFFWRCCCHACLRRFVSLSGGKPNRNGKKKGSNRKGRLPSRVISGRFSNFAVFDYEVLMF